MSTPITRAFELATNGEHPDIDAMRIMAELMRELDDRQRAGVLGYLNALFGEDEE